MVHLVLVRHGESVWNSENKYTGWADIGLSAKGVKESKVAGKILREYSFDKFYTSGLCRAKNTLEIVLETLGVEGASVTATKSLNERNFGALEGLGKSAALEEYGETKMENWLKGFEFAPPYGESLKETSERVLRFFKTVVVRDLKNGKSVLLVAHGAVMRILIGALLNRDWENSVDIRVPNAKPHIYSFDKTTAAFSTLKLI